MHSYNESYIHKFVIFNRDEDLVNKYMTQNLKIPELIEMLLSRNKLSADSKGQLLSLRNRLVPNKSVTTHNIIEKDINTNNPISNENIPIKKSKHIMLSYAWKVGKPLVEALQAQLIGLGHDVWRDETGSSIVSSMQGDVLEKMSEAIENSHTIIMCISRWFTLCTIIHLL